MYDKELTIDILMQIAAASETVLDRFEPVSCAADFTDSPRGMEKLDSICMLLIAIGEGLKKVDTITNGNLLEKYPDIDWKGAKGLRDIITHHYFDVDAEEIFWVCEKHLPSLKNAVEIIIRRLKE